MIVYLDITVTFVLCPDILSNFFNILAIGEQSNLIFLDFWDLVLFEQEHFRMTLQNM